ncbi:malonyl-ACP O-methyltransferase BioC [Baia soyae]|uniref:Malonyl-[acyl-carrier protein] O-methyltransferase n=1 Tax=Baia soyae TaxID=1544746 RepID=A0A4R2S5H2_9BACL|nr:malonyl-ACP O-methyltransferase BioC [Baia soyae]TCP66505.1 malonyl-CoA O-methyltransferase [Baia soyae]
MIIHKHILEKNFNKAAHTYDEYSQVQQKMAHHLIQTLHQKNEYVDRILEIGCGTGYFTQLLAETYPDARITAIDLAENMIQKAQEQMEERNVEFVLADAEELSEFSSESYDLIVSNAAVHWLQRPGCFLSGIMRLLKPGGSYLSTALGPDTFLELRSSFQYVEKKLGVQPTEHLVPLTSMEDWAVRLEESGFQGTEIEDHWLRQVYTDCRELLQSIKATGANYRSNRQSIFEARKILIRMMKLYNQAYRNKQGLVYATYQWMQIMTKKPG